jgi:TonB family protein
MNTFPTRPKLAAAAMVTALLFASTATGEITPPKIIQTEPARFPAALDFTAITEGEAELVLNIDRTGKLTDAIAIGYTHKAFAREALDAVRRWRYEPARAFGEPIDRRLKLTLHFSSQMRIVTLTPGETPASRLRKAGVPEGITLLCEVDDLDSPIKVLHPATPVHPGRTASLPNGRTVLDFYVDETGRARLPLVAESTHPAFSFAAVKALQDWRFAAPKRKGRPAIVRMQQEFVFENGT